MYHLILQEQASGSEAIGQIYQDEKNMAAILMRRQLETGDLMMVSNGRWTLAIKRLFYYCR